MASEDSFGGPENVPDLSGTTLDLVTYVGLLPVFLFLLFYFFVGCTGEDTADDLVLIVDKTKFVFSAGIIDMKISLDFVRAA